jgi:3-deoxy-D-manno-octulosonate 8-phosphate phosphatase (KDO 8-P phosphatase)
MKKPARTADLTRRLRRVKLFCCDVDGVLTDAGVYMGGGEETKRFNIRDGLGLRLLQRAGIRVSWISHRESVATTQRAADLKVDFLHQSPEPKTAVVEQLLAQTGLTWDEVCFVGDDIVDLGALRRAGLAVAVASGVAEARAVAHYVTKAAAGHGAIREIAETILQAQGRWASFVQEYSA